MNPDVESPGEKYWREEREAWRKEYPKRRAAGLGLKLEAGEERAGGHSAQASEEQGLPEL